MAKDKCPECPDEGLPIWMGTFADMMTLLFAFFVLMFSMATLDPVKLDAMGGDKAGSDDQEKKIEEIKKEMQELKEAGVTAIKGMKIEEYQDSLIQASTPPPRISQVKKDVGEIIEDMELEDSTKISKRDPRGLVFELAGDICFKSASTILEPTLAQFLDAAIDSFLANPNDLRQVIIEGHTDNEKPTRKIAEKYPTNWELSSARASAVVNYLIDQGVNPSRLVAHGYAERWPADLTWADMRRGYVYADDRVGGVDRIVEKREQIPIESLIDSLNSTVELRRKNRRIKIIFTQNNYVAGASQF